jgi:hypothetical protein
MPWKRSSTAAKANRNLARNKLHAPVRQNGALYTPSVVHPSVYGATRLSGRERAGQWFSRATGRGVNYSKLGKYIPGPWVLSPHAKRTVQVGPNVPKSLLVQSPSLQRVQLNGLAMNFKEQFPFGRTGSGRAVMPDPRRAIVKAPSFTGHKIVNNSGKRVGRLGRSRRLTPNRRSPSLGKIGAAQREELQQMLDLVARVRASTPSSNTSPNSTNTNNSSRRRSNTPRPGTPSLISRIVRRHS